MSEPGRELRISVRGLETGMFISRLDRPWLESPFPLEGLMIRSKEVIDSVQRLCSYVFIDIDRGSAPDPRYLEYGDSPLIRDAHSRDELAALRKTEWHSISDFSAELKHADRAHGLLEVGFGEVMDDLRTGRNLDLVKLKEGVSAMVESIIRNPAAFVWLKEIKRRDSYAYQHALGTAVWGASFGRHLGLDRAELGELALGGLLCDVGKTRVPHELLLQEGPLNVDQQVLMRQHVLHSLEIVQTMPGLSSKITEMVATHHERHDGSGYPNGLKGTDIPIFGRIMGIVDSYDAMTCQRPYAKSRSPHEAVGELYAHRDTLFQSELVEQFIQTCGIYPTGSLVELSTGEVGVITAVHSLKRLRPRLMLLLDRNKQPLPQFLPLDLAVAQFDENGAPLVVKTGLPVGAFGIDPQELFLD